jgi:hypothetical protein
MIRWQLGPQPFRNVLIVMSVVTQLRTVNVSMTLRARFLHETLEMHVLEVAHFLGFAFWTAGLTSRAFVVDAISTKMTPTT